MAWHKGVPTWNKGKHWSEETKRKIGKNSKKRIITQEFRDKMKEVNRTRVYSEETLERISNRVKNYWKNPESREKLINIIRLNAFNRRNGVSLLYPSDWTNSLKDSIRQRDNYECKICKIKQEKLNGRFKKLDIHHIDYNKNNLCPDNLISLCHSCHMKTNNNRDYWTNYFNMLS